MPQPNRKERRHDEKTAREWPLKAERRKRRPERAYCKKCKRVTRHTFDREHGAHVCMVCGTISFT